MGAERHIAVLDEEGVVRARQSAREIARELRFGPVDQTRITTAVSELARNIIQHTTNGRGDVIVRSLEESGGRVGVEIVASDTGPGIADVERALEEGFSSGRGLGLGLPGTRRLMDEMTIDTALGRGTTVTVRKWRR